MLLQPVHENHPRCVVPISECLSRHRLHILATQLPSERTTLCTFFCDLLPNGSADAPYCSNEWTCTCYMSAAWSHSIHSSHNLRISEACLTNKQSAPFNLTLNATADIVRTNHYCDVQFQSKSHIWKIDVSELQCWHQKKTLAKIHHCNCEKMLESYLQEICEYVI